MKTKTLTTKSMKETQEKEANARKNNSMREEKRKETKGLQKEMMTNISDENEEIVTPPGIQLPCPGPMDSAHPQNTRQETNGVNYNQMYEKTTNKMVGAAQPPQNVYLDQGPMAANEALGLSSF